MNLNNPVRLERAFILGLVNGLLAGGVAYTLLWLSVEYENSRPSESGLNIHVSVGIEWWVPSFIGGVAVSIASVLIHKFLSSRVKSILLLWQCVAVTSVLCGYVFVIILEIANDRLRGYPPFELGRWISASAGGAVLTALAFVAAFNLLYGAFIKLVLAQYSRKRSFELP
jgi:ABC-type Fe3+-siderophore transport system permease subunit